MKDEVCVEPIVLITKRNEIDEYRAIHNPIIELPDKIKKCEPFDMTIKVGSPYTQTHWSITFHGFKCF